MIDILNMFRALKQAYEELPDKSGIEPQMEYESHLDSRIPMLEHYRCMLAEWDECANKYALTREDIFRIIYIAGPLAPQSA